MPGYCCKSRQARNDPVSWPADRHIHPQAAADAGRIVLKHAVQLIEIAEQISGAFVIDHPVLGELNPARGAVQQAHPQMVFQRLNLARDAPFGRLKVRRRGKNSPAPRRG
jgi:hypothetical protein